MTQYRPTMGRLMNSTYAGVIATIKNESVIIKADGSDKTATPAKKADDFKLPQLQKIVGGLIDVIRLQGELDGWIMVINDEGKINCLGTNLIATVVARQTGSIFQNDWIAGDVLVCRDEMVK